MLKLNTMNTDNKKQVTPSIPTITQSIDTLIKIIPAYAYKKKDADEPGVKTLIVDYESGEVLDELPFLYSLGFQKLRFYKINRNEALLNVRGPGISASYPGSDNPFTIEVSYDVKIAEKGLFNLIRTIYQSTSPLEAINSVIRQKITGFIFEKHDFVKSYKQYEFELLRLISDTGARIGLTLNPSIKHPFSNHSAIPDFIDCSHKVVAKTKDGQDVEIDHTLALTLTDDIKYMLSKIIDLNKWAKSKLEQFTKNALVEKTYAEVLINLDQDMIKSPMQVAAKEIGYEIKQLIIVPGIDIEKFYFETDDNTLASVKEFNTIDSRVKVSLNIIVSGKLDLQHYGTKKFIKPGIDIIAGMKRLVQDTVRNYINGIAPQQYFTQQSKFQEDLKSEVSIKLMEQYGFKEIEILVKLLENDLIKRLSLLQEQPFKVNISGDWGSRNYELWFKVLDVSKDGWYRFFANNYKSREEELSEIGRLVKNGMERAIFRTDDDITGELIKNAFAEVNHRTKDEFGLVIKIHDFLESISDAEKLFIGNQKNNVAEDSKRQSLINASKTEELEHLILQKNELLKQGEYADQDELKKLNKKIEHYKLNMKNEKNKFLGQKTSNSFLLNDDDSDLSTETPKIE